MAARTPCLRREGMISATSPNQEGVAGTDSEDVWMSTEESAILVISTSLLGTLLFFLIKEAYFYARSLLVTSRCAIRGHGVRESDIAPIANAGLAYRQRRHKSHRCFKGQI